MDKVCRVHGSRCDHQVRFGFFGSFRFFAVAGQGSQPFFRCRTDLFFIQIHEHVLQIAYQRNGRTCVLTDFCRVYVDMDQYLVVFDFIGTGNGTVRHPGAGQQDHVRLVHGPVAVGLPVVAYHTEKHGMFRRHGSQAHHGGNHRDPMLIRKGTDHIRRAA